MGFIGNLFFRVVGAFSKWILMSIWMLFTRSKPKKFGEIWNGKRRGGHYAYALDQVSNSAVGIFIVAFILLLILYIKR